MNLVFKTLFLLLIHISLFGQTFTGLVLDKESKQGIPSAQVYFVDLKTGTTTDKNGVFKIKFNEQSLIHLHITFIGYKSIDQVVNFDTTAQMIFFLEQSHLEMEEVVVSAPSGRLQGASIVSVDHKKITEIQRSLPITLAETISNIPGVEQTTTGVGLGKPVIRGLSGNRIVTYAHGIRIENQQWGDEHGLGVGAAGIESVEIIKGPASLLYGSDALGGVIFFIDERYASQNSIEGFAQSNFYSNTLGTTNNIGFKFNKQKIKFNVFAAYSSHADYKVPSFDRVSNTRFNEINAKGSLGFNTKHWISNIRYSFLRNNYGIVEDGNYSGSSKRKFVLPFQSIDDNSLSLENIFYIGSSKIELIVGYTNNYRREFEDDEIIHALGMNLSTSTYNLKWYSPTYANRFDLVVGSQGMLQTNKNNGEEFLIPDAGTRDFGAFILGNLNYDNIQLQAGIRADYRKIDTKETGGEHEGESGFPVLNSSYSGLTFSGGAVYQLEHIKLRANISSGFRAPNTTELLSDGVHHGTLRYIKGDSSLANENNLQADFSFHYEDDHFSFSINPFYNIINNYIILSPAKAVIKNNPVFNYIQTDAVLYGGEMGFHYHPHLIHWLHLESNLSSVFAEDKNQNPLPLIPQTKISSTISLELMSSGVIQITNAFIQHIYKFPQNRLGMFESASMPYSLINMGLNFDIETGNNPIEISTGVNNLFNTKYIDHLSRFKTLEIPNAGINFYINVKIRLNKKLSD